MSEEVGGGGLGGCSFLRKCGRLIEVEFRESYAENSIRSTIIHKAEGYNYHFRSYADTGDVMMEIVTRISEIVDSDYNTECGWATNGREGFYSWPKIVKQ